MSDDNRGRNIGELNDIPQFDNGALFPVFYGNVTYKYTLGQLLSQANRNTVGLGNVDNTTDLDKPVSNATQTALNDKANTAHSHVIDDVSNLSGILTGKSDLGHGHSVEEISGLSQSLQSKANLSHTHVIASVDGLQSSLDDKAQLSHTHEISGVNGLTNALTTKADSTTVTQALLGKSDLNHYHDASEITNLPEIPTGLATEVFVQAAIANEPVHVHTHSISAVNGLSEELTGKASVGHQHVIGDVNGLAATLASKAEQSHQHTILEVTGLNQALALKSDTSFVTQQLATKAQLSHTHSSSEVTDLAATLTPYALTDDVSALIDVTTTIVNQTINSGLTNLENTINSLTLVVDNKTDTGHTHKPADIANFDGSVKDIVAAYLLPGNNVQIDNSPTGLTISSTGGGSNPVTSNSLKIFHLTAQSQYYEFIESQASVPSIEYVIGEDLVTFSSYDSIYQFAKDGMYRIRVDVTARRVNDGNPPNIIPPSEVQITYGSRIENYSNVEILSSNIVQTKSVVDLLNATPVVVSWSNEYLVNISRANAQAVIKTFLYGKDGVPLDPSDWEMYHDTTVVIERYTGTTDNFVRSPGNINILKLTSDNQSIESGNTTIAWDILSQHGQDLLAIGYDSGFDEFILNNPGCYRVTLQSTVGRSISFANGVTVSPDPFIRCSYGTVISGNSGLEILSNERLATTGTITLIDEGDFTGWLHEFYVSAPISGSRLTVKDWFNASVTNPDEWKLLFNATITFERLGDSLVAPV